MPMRAKPMQLNFTMAILSDATAIIVLVLSCEPVNTFYAIAIFSIGFTIANEQNKFN